MASDNKTYDCDAVTLHYASDIYAPHPKVMTINIDPPRPIHRAINFTGYERPSMSVLQAKGEHILIKPYERKMVFATRSRSAAAY